MSQKKARHPFLDEVEAKLGSLPGFRVKAMFGGHGLYTNECFFAVVDQGRIYFRVTDETRPDYQSAGMGPFNYAPGMVMQGYYEVPPAVWKDDVLRIEWAIRAAMREPKKSKAKGKPKK
ncbi:MAG: TfoX/Sxy family protein [Gemmataceae bacterium]